VRKPPFLRGIPTRVDVREITVTSLLEHDGVGSVHHGGCTQGGIVGGVYTTGVPREHSKEDTYHPGYTRLPTTLGIPGYTPP